jgi:hypothetical protein
MLVSTHTYIIIISNGTTAQSHDDITMWVISPMIDLILVILIQSPETSSGEATIDI